MSTALISISSALSQTPVYTARPRIQGSASCAMLVYAQLSVVLIVPTHGGMARLSWPGWLVTHRGGLPICWQPPIQLLTALINFTEQTQRITHYTKQRPHKAHNTKTSWIWNAEYTDSMCILESWWRHVTDSSHCLQWRLIEEWRLTIYHLHHHDPHWPHVHLTRHHINHNIDHLQQCRHDMRPSVQLTSVSGVDSKLGHHTSHDYARYASFFRFLIINNFDLDLTNWKLHTSNSNLGSHSTFTSISVFLHGFISESGASMEQTNTKQTDTQDT